MGNGAREGALGVCGERRSIGGGGLNRQLTMPGHQMTSGREVLRMPPSGERLTPTSTDRRYPGFDRGRARNPLIGKALVDERQGALNGMRLTRGGRSPWLRIKSCVVRPPTGAAAGVTACLEQVWPR